MVVIGEKFARNDPLHVEHELKISLWKLNFSFNFFLIHTRFGSRAGAQEEGKVSEQTPSQPWRETRAEQQPNSWEPQDFGSSK